MKQRFVITLILATASILRLSNNAVALPQYSLLTGNKCINCHYTTQGGGGRTELGWYSGKDMKLLSARSIGMGGLDEIESNTLADGSLALGGDVRFQSVRSPRSDDATRKLIPMQFALYGSYQATSWLTAEAMVEIGALYLDMSGKGVPYNGQQSWMASVIIQPIPKLPALRIGHFQPSIGMRYDDHTMLIRQIPGANGSSLIPPNYAEYGAELSYDGLKWLTASVGAFLPKALAGMTTTTPGGETIPLLINTVPVDASLVELVRSPSLSARVVISPRTDDHLVNTYAGASLLTNDVFTLVNAFAGVGLTGKASLMAEYALSGVQNGRQTRAVSIELSAQPFVWLLPFVRYEYGTTQTNPRALPSALYSRQVSFGTQFFPLPFVEIRPEYRLTTTEVYDAKRWTVQLHLFF